MAATQELCDICEQRHVTKSSSFLCPECEQAFCNDCNAYHGFLKLSKHHVTVSIQDHSALSSSISQISNTCMDHNEQYQLVCQAHDELLCLTCIEKHDGCKGIITISKVIENVKKSSLFQETQQSLNGINRNIEMLQKELKKQKGSIQHQEDTILSQISDTRNKINDHLHKLEEKIRNEVYDITEKLYNDMNQTLQILENKNVNTNDAEQPLKDMERNATDVQTYLGLRKISSEATITESSLQSIIRDHSLDKNTLLLQIDDKISNIINNIKTFGPVQVQTTPCQISLVRHKNKQAQIVEVKMKISIADIKLKLTKTIKTGVSRMKGIVSLPSGNIALSEYTNSRGEVMIFDSDGVKLSKVIVEDAKSFDITYIDDRTLAATSPLQTHKGVCIIDIKEKKISKFIRTNYQCYGIKHHDGSLFVCAMS
ncbi:probable RING finger protein 207 homolog [Mytilus trossulus]|uniref:probable RING finger protein 207 homolog n=1 Tax=Mytilus trossulus TaxID=6551 RepID=UPI003007D324